MKRGVANHTPIVTAPEDVTTGHQPWMTLRKPMAKTRSETLFETWLTSNSLPFRSISAERGVSTPDYGVTIGEAEIIFELKQIEAGRNWADEMVHSGEVGKFIRDRITKSKRQIQAASKGGKPTVLIIYNDYDPFQLFGTEDHDFEHAMYGADTVVLARESGRLVDRFHGDGKSFQSSKNTSFSALARLRQAGRDAEVTVTIFENMHAAVPIDYVSLPPCFKVVRVNQSR
ncbi:hypothetical protein [Neorhizobium tomejilense]|uniref:hypothetical protein n=1 Tax=Neorhizobium tomejilense TaxID=2093828 RepID=UPI00155E3B0D|nr:hypothetical protein [Neorhizobium tomejilense]